MAGDRPATVKDFVDHIDYAVKLIGIDHVGISSDFDGGGGSPAGTTPARRSTSRSNWSAAATPKSKSRRSGAAASCASGRTREGLPKVGGSPLAEAGLKACTTIWWRTICLSGQNVDVHLEQVIDADAVDAVGLHRNCSSVRGADHRAVDDVCVATFLPVSADAHFERIGGLAVGAGLLHRVGWRRR